MGLQLITPPDAEPINAVEAKAHMRVDSSDEEDLIFSLIVAARKAVENFTSRALITQTWELSWDVPPKNRFVQLPKPLLQSVTSITSYDEDNVATVMDAAGYYVDTSDGQGGRVFLKSGATWPIPARLFNSTVIQFVAGYGDTGEQVPEPIIHAMKLMVAHWFENREPVNIGNITSELPLMVPHLLFPYKLLRL